MRHTAAIAGRELRSYFTSPVAYAVLVLFSLLGGFFFVLQLSSFNAAVAFYQQTQQLQALESVNLNDYLIFGFYQLMWLVLLILVPGLTMGLFSSEKANGTEELLLTSPVTIWEIVLGKYLAAAAMVTILTAVLAALTGIVFFYGDPEPLQTAAGLAGVWLVGLAYAAVGSFTSSVTRSPLIAFFFSVFLLFILFMLGPAADMGMAGATGSEADGVLRVLRWLSSEGHFNELTTGLVDTRALAYFGFIIGVFLLLTKASFESVRWR